MRKSVDIVAVIFVGHLGRHYLAAAGIASVTANVTGNSMLIGFSGALSTLCGWAKGANDTEALYVALQRALIILPLCICLPVSLMWTFSAKIMIMCGQQVVMSELAQQYMRLLIPGLWARAIALCVQNWLYAQEHMMIIAYATSFSAFCNVILCYLLVMVFGFGFTGAAISTSLCRIIEASLMVGYLVYNSYQKNSLLIGFRWTRECLTGWQPYFQLAMPSLLMIAEWWASELLIFMAGMLVIDPELQVSTMSIYQSLISMCFMFPSCLRVAAGTRVGNELGANNPNKAKASSFVATILALWIGMFVAFILLCFPQVCFCFVVIYVLYAFLSVIMKTIVWYVGVGQFVYK